MVFNEIDNVIEVYNNSVIELIQTNATLLIINLFNVFLFFIMYIFPHHISFVTISVSVYMLFFTSTHKFFKLLYIFVGNKLKNCKNTVFWDLVLWSDWSPRKLGDQIPTKELGPKTLYSFNNL